MSREGGNRSLARLTLATRIRGAAGDILMHNGLPSSFRPTWFQDEGN